MHFGEDFVWKRLGDLEEGGGAAGGLNAGEFGFGLGGRGLVGVWGLGLGCVGMGVGISARSRERTIVLMWPYIE